MSDFNRRRRAEARLKQIEREKEAVKGFFLVFSSMFIMFCIFALLAI